MKHKCLCNWAIGSVVAFALAATSPNALGATSHDGTRVGVDNGDNAIQVCEPGTIYTIAGTNQSRHVSTFTNYSSDGTAAHQVYSSIATQRAAMNCYSDPGHTTGLTLATGAYSIHGSGVTCPSGAPYGAYASCAVQSNQQPFVYLGTPCGNGVSRIYNMRYIGQETGSSISYLGPNGAPTGPLINNTYATANVASTDLGNIFFSAGTMYYAFGDTNPASGGVQRHSVLAKSLPVDPSGGIYFFDWENKPGGTANQIIPGIACPSCGFPDGKDSPIPSGGWAITETIGGVKHTYRYLWFMSVKNWSSPPALLMCLPTNDPNCTWQSVNVSVGLNNASIAVSVDDGQWQRLDSSVSWGADSNFTNVAAYVDPTGIGDGSSPGYVYFLGIKANGNLPNSTSHIKLARVRATSAAIRTQSSYQYWKRSAQTWVNNESDADYLIISGGPVLSNVRELSVAYDSYANSFMLMFLHANSQLNGQGAVVCDPTNTYLELYTSPTLNGRWTAAATGGVGSGNPLPNVCSMYAPLLHDRNLEYGGRAYFLLSEALPYQVGLWSFDVSPKVADGCFAP